MIPMNNIFKEQRLSKAHEGEPLGIVAKFLNFEVADRFTSPRNFLLC